MEVAMDALLAELLRQGIPFTRVDTADPADVLENRGIFSRRSIVLRSAGVASRRGIGERQVTEFNFSADFAPLPWQGLRVVDLRLRIENVVHAAHGGRAALENVRQSRAPPWGR